MDLAEKRNKKMEEKDSKQAEHIENKGFHTQKIFSKKVLTNWFSFGIMGKLARGKPLRGTERERADRTLKTIQREKKRAIETERSRGKGRQRRFRRV